ncbi:hypothetical protein BGZ76_011236 [Entomortierella beljakovae]|nr:hypothetical protein BGZ76_011236 [Entomortierella beljakovae]
MEDAPHNYSNGVVSAEHQKDKNVAKSVKLWFKEIEDKSGKTMFVDDATLTGFEYGWCTKFQLEIMSKNTSICCMDSTHMTAKDITPIKEDSKVFKSVYLFTLLVKDKDIQQGIPVAFMACKCVSQYFLFYFLVSASCPMHRAITPFLRAVDSHVFSLPTLDISSLGGWTV